MIHVPAALSEALRTRYLIERELGRGGMARVYLAQDVKHGRRVAIKVLSPEISALIGTERFLREIGVTARLQHPHILTLIDSGSAAGLLYYVMPYIEGESLRTRLERERQLPLSDALAIARDVASALDHAHARGIVHRDIKPENILLDEGGATVADFGIALATDDDRLTRAGVPIGTPVYMSPEQVNASPSVDGRTDQYSLACVVYEMLAGEPPHTGASAQAIMAKRMSEPPPRVRVLRDVSPAMEAALRRGLSRSPADRFPSTGRFVAALEAASRDGSPPRRLGRHRVLALAVLAALMLLGGVFARRSFSGRTAAAGSPRMPLLAVLPFSHDGASENEYFSRGIADEIRERLSAVPGLRVISGASSKGIQPDGKSPREIANDLGATHLVTGRVRWAPTREGPRLDVSTRLQDAATGEVRWADSSTRSLSEVFDLQSAVATGIAHTLTRAGEKAARERLRTQPTANLTAYEAYLRGSDILLGSSAASQADLRRAVQHLERSVALDSTFASAWARLGIARAALGLQNPGAEEQLYRSAKAAADRALALDTVSHEAYRALSFYHAVQGDPAAAIRHAEQGLRLAPHYAPLLRDVAASEESLGLWERARAHRLTAVELEPNSAGAFRGLALNALCLRRHGEAHRAADKYLEVAPANPHAWWLKVMVFVAEGRLDDARAVIRRGERQVDRDELLAYIGERYSLYWVLDSAQQSRLLQVRPDVFGQDTASWGLALAGLHHLRGNRVRSRAYADTARRVLESAIAAGSRSGPTRVYLALARAYLGDHGAARSAADEGLRLQPMSKDAYIAAQLQHMVAEVELLAGDHDRAVSTLETLLHIPYVLTPAWLGIDSRLEPLRAHPRFRTLVEQRRAGGTPASR